MVKEGNYVVIKTKRDELKGLLLKSQNPEKFVLKLSSGYNTSINKKDVLKIEKVTEEKVKKVLSKIKLTKNPSLRNILMSRLLLQKHKVTFGSLCPENCKLRELSCR